MSGAEWGVVGIGAGGGAGARDLREPVLMTPAEGLGTGWLVMFPHSVPIKVGIGILHKKPPVFRQTTAALIHTLQSYASLKLVQTLQNHLHDPTPVFQICMSRGS